MRSQPSRLGMAAPPDPFFPTFAGHYWEREPGAFPGAVPDPVVTPDGFFRALATAGERSLNGDPDVDFCFWVEGQKLDDFRQFLPRRADGSLLAYADRIEGRLGGSEYMLMIADIHIYDDAFWNPARQFLRELFRHTGLPRGWVDTSAFLGRYHRTPFGVHKGHMSVLTFPMVGEKHFRLWSGDYVASHPELKGLRSYDTFCGGSEVIVGRHGDALYWPARVWHLAEGTGAFTAAWNFGFWLHQLDDHSLQHVLGRVGQMVSDDPEVAVEDEETFPFDPDRPGELAEAVPQSWVATAEALVRACEGGALSRALAAEWARTVSACGFRKVPPPLPPAPVASRDQVEVINEAVLLDVPIGDGEVALAANGHVFTIPANPRVRAALHGLRSGARMRAGDFVNACVGAVSSGGFDDEATPEEALALLQILVRIRAIRIATDPQQQTRAGPPGAGTQNR
jgi:hypothetical protein